MEKSYTYEAIDSSDIEVLTSSDLREGSSEQAIDALDGLWTGLVEAGEPETDCQAWVNTAVGFMSSTEERLPHEGEVSDRDFRRAAKQSFRETVGKVEMPEVVHEVIVEFLLKHWAHREHYEKYTSERRAIADKLQASMSKKLD